MDIFDTNVLVQVVPNLLLAKNALLDKFFPGFVEAETEEISIDVDVGKRRMSPFVSPLVAGRLVEGRTVQTNTFKPAYIKDKRAPDLRRPVRRQIGERIGGGLTGEERMQANLNFELADQVDMLNRRMEWMAASAIQSGSVTVSGDGYPSTVVNFGRDASLTVTLVGNAMWDSGNAAAQPAANINTWATQILKKSGAVPTDIVFSPTAFVWFTRDPDVKNQIFFDTARLANAGLNNVNAASQVEHGLMYKGRWGNFDLWIYNDWYVDDNNVEQRMIPDGSVFLTGQAMMGTRAYGMILDPAFAYGALAYAPKSWLENDPAQRLILMQSAPLVIPSRVNTTLYANVANAVL